MFLTILDYAFLIIAVWGIAGMLLMFLIGRGIAIAEKRRVSPSASPQKPRVRVRGRHLHITTPIN